MYSDNSENFLFSFKECTFISKRKLIIKVRTIFPILLLLVQFLAIKELQYFLSNIKQLKTMF